MTWSLLSIFAIFMIRLHVIASELINLDCYNCSPIDASINDSSYEIKESIPSRYLLNSFDDSLSQQKQNNSSSDVYFFVNGVCINTTRVNSSLPLLIGKNVSSAITCSICSHDLDKIKSIFYWRIPSRKMSNSRSTTRVKITEKQTENNCRRYDLDLLDVYPNDTGIIECIINITNNVTKQHLTEFRGVRNVEAYYVPQVTLAPMPPSVNQGEKISVSCNVKLHTGQHLRQVLTVTLAAYNNNKRLFLTNNAYNTCEEFLESTLENKIRFRLWNDGHIEIKKKEWSNICLNNSPQKFAQSICKAIGFQNEHPIVLRLSQVNAVKGIQCNSKRESGMISDCEEREYCPGGWIGVDCAAWTYSMERNKAYKLTFQASFSTCHKKDNVTVNCRAENGVDAFEDLNTVHIEEIFERPFCEALEDDHGIWWRRTATNEKLIRKCPNTMEGFSERFCDRSAKWQPPNYSSCIRSQIKDLADKMFNRTQINVTNILITLNNSVRNEGLLPLTAADLMDSISILQGVVEQQHDDRQFNHQMKVVINIADKLLDPNTLTSWKMLEKNMSVILMKTLEDYGKLMAQRYGSNLTMRSENLEFFIKTVGKGERFSFPSHGVERNYLSLSDDYLQAATEDGSINISCLIYKTLGDFFTTHEDEKISSWVMSISVNSLQTKTVGLPNLLSLNFNNVKLSASHRPFCSYWNFSAISTSGSSWFTDGCQVKQYSIENQTVDCICDHMTNFAILMSPKKVSPFHDVLLSMLTLIGCTMSIVCLIVTIVSHLCIWKAVSSIRTVLLMNLSTSLCLAKIVFLAGIIETSNANVCKFVAVLLHYLYLVVFSFMLCHGLLLYLLAVKVFTTGVNLNFRLSALGWGLPFLVVGVSLAARRTEGYGTTDYCWLSQDYGMIYAFIVPVAVIILINTIIIIMAIRSMVRSTRNANTATDKEKIKALLWNICLLLPLLGVTWTFGFLAILDKTLTFHYLFVIFNSFQGVLIFVFYCVRNPRIQQCVSDLFRNKNKAFATGKYTLTKLTGDSTTASAVPKKKTSTDRFSLSSGNCPAVKL